MSPGSYPEHPADCPPVVYLRSILHAAGRTPGPTPPAREFPLSQHGPELCRRAGPTVPKGRSNLAAGGGNDEDACRHMTAVWMEELVERFQQGGVSGSHGLGGSTPVDSIQGPNQSCDPCKESMPVVMLRCDPCPMSGV